MVLGAAGQRTARGREAVISNCMKPVRLRLQALNASFERYQEERRSQSVREHGLLLQNTAAG